MNYNFTAKCPNKTSPEWKKLVDYFGEEESIKIFIANNEDVPNLLDIHYLISKHQLENKIEKEELSPEQQEHYINIFAGLLDDEFLRISKQSEYNDDELPEWSLEYKSNFIRRIKNSIYESNLDEDKKLLTYTALKLLEKENSELWEKVVAEQKTQYYTEGLEEVDAEEAINKIGFGERQWTSTEKTVTNIVKAAINRLKKRKPTTYKDYLSSPQTSLDTDTFSGLAERLRYKDYAGGLFRHYLGVKTLSDILDRTKEIAVYEPSFYQLFEQLSKDDKLLNAFGRDIVRQFKPATILLLTDKKVKNDIEGKKSLFEYQLADHIRTVVFANITSNVYDENKEKLAKSEFKKLQQNSELPTNDKINIILNLLNILDINVDTKDIYNIFKVIPEDKILKVFKKSFDGLINNTNTNVFGKNNLYKKYIEEYIKVNDEITELDKELSNKTIVKEKKANQKKNTKALKKVTNNIDGYILEITKLVEKVRIDQPDIVTMGVNNNQKTLVKFNNGYTDFFNLKNNKKLLLQRLTELAQTPGSIYVNFLFGPKGLLIKNSDGTYSLNEDNIDAFDYNDDGGIKNTLTQEGYEYLSDFSENTHKIKALEYSVLSHKYYIPTPSDSATTHLISFNDWTLFSKKEIESNYNVVSEIKNRTKLKEALTNGLIYEDRIEEIKEYIDESFNTIINKDWFKALWNTVMKEVADMQTAFDLMFEYDEQGNLIKKDLKFALEEGYHYIVKNGKPVYIENNKPTGKVFRFNNMSWKKNGVEKTLNDYIDGVIYQGDLYVKEKITQEDGTVVIVNNPTKLNTELKEAVLEFVESTINVTNESFFSLHSIIPEDVKTVAGSLNNAISNFAINDFLFQVELQNLFGNKTNDILKTIDILKRSKDSTGAAYSLENAKEGFYNITIKDVYLDKIYLSETIELKGDELTDGISLVTTKEHLKRIQKEGGKELDINKAILKQQKNFYGHVRYNENTKKNEQLQIKNSELAVSKKIWAGHQLEQLIDFMERLEAKLGVGIQISFASAVKRGKKDNIIDITDGKGNIVMNTEIEKQLEEAKEFCYYANLRKVQDTNVHIVDQNIKLGTQLSKIIIANLNNNNTYLGKKSKNLIQEFFDILDANVREGYSGVLNTLKDEEGNITEKSLLAFVKTEAVNRNWGDNIVNALQATIDGNTVQPIDYPPMVDRIEQVLTSLFTNNVIKQKHKGYHAFQAPNMFMDNIISTQEQSESSFKGEIDWSKAKLESKSKKLLGLRQINKTTLEIEVLVSKWDSKFKKLAENGKPISINDIPEEALISLGFRIPTEGKFSSFVFKVVGFLPDNMEGTIIVPDGFIQLTGSDFDIDSIYTMTKHLDDDLKAIKYDEKSKPLDNSRAARENRIFQIYEAILMHEESFKEISTKSEYQDIQDAVANVLEKKNYNTNLFYESINITKNILSNVELKGQAVNYSVLATICNVAKIYTVGSKLIPQFDVNVPFTEEDAKKYGKRRFVSNHIGVRETDNYEFSDLNLNGEYITNYISKTVANIMDAVKYPMAPNINKYTIGVFMLFPMYGYPNYKYGTYFISQGVISECIKNYDIANGAFKKKVVGDEYQRVSNKIYTSLAFLNAYDVALKGADAFFLDKISKKTNIFDRAEINAAIRKAEENGDDNKVKELKKLLYDLEKNIDFDINNFTQREKEFLRLGNKLDKEFNEDELLERVKFFQDNNRIFDLPIIADKLVQENSDSENLNAIILAELKTIFKASIPELKAYLIEQLSILEQFKKYKNMDAAIVSLSVRLNADKKEVGPKLRENNKYVNDIVRSTELGDKYNFQILHEGVETNALQAIYFDKDSAYKHLRSKYIYGALAAKNLLNKYFIQANNEMINMMFDYVRPAAHDAFKKEVNRHLLIDQEFFLGSTYGTDGKQLRKQVLGINTLHISKIEIGEVNGVKQYEDFDLTNDNAEHLQLFKSLSAANQLMLVKKQFTKLFKDKLLSHHIISAMNNDNRDETEHESVKLIRINNLRAKNRYSKQFGEMLASQNLYIREFAYNLIRYNFFMTGWNYASNNLSDIVPVEYLSGELGKSLGLDFNGHYREKKTNPIPISSETLDFFHQKNYRNKEFVPEAYNITKRELGEDNKYHNVPDPYYPVWHEFISGNETQGFIYIDKNRAKRLDSRLKSSKYITVSHKINGEFETKIYRRESVIYFEPTDVGFKEHFIGYIYVALNKLEKFEDDYTSVFEENNNANYNEAIRKVFEQNTINNYIQQLESLKTDKSSNNAPFKKEEDFTEYTVVNDIAIAQLEETNYSDDEIKQALLERNLEYLEHKQEYDLVNIIKNRIPKINTEDAKKFTETKIGTNKDIHISKVSKDGVGVEKAAEDIFFDLIDEKIIDENNPSIDTAYIITIIEDYLVESKDSEKEEIKQIKEKLKKIKKEDKKENNNDNQYTLFHDILYFDLNYTDDMLLIKTAKEASMEVLKLIDNFAHYGSFEAKKTVKNIITKPIEKFTDAELISVYTKLASTNYEIFDLLGIDRAGGFHSKTDEEKRRIVAKLIELYKEQIENTTEGILNNIRIPHKNIKELTEEELKYNLALIVEYFITRVAYTQHYVNRFKVNPPNINDSKERNRLTELLLHVSLVKDIMLELDKIRYVKDTDDLSPTQVQINHLIIVLNDYRKQFISIVADSDIIYENYIIETIQSTTTNRELLDSDNIREEIKKQIALMRDASFTQMLLDAPKDTTNIIIANLLKFFKIEKNIASDKAKKHIKEFEEIMADVDDYSEIFLLDKSGNRTGKIKDLDFINDDNNRRLAAFLMDLKHITKDINTNSVVNIVDLGYIPAQAILDKSKWKIIKEHLGYFDSFDKNIKTVTDSKGNSLKSVTMKFSSFISRKQLIAIPFDKLSTETKAEYDSRLREYILTLTGLSFDNRQQIEEYNAQVIAYNKMLKGTKHGTNINYDLAEVIPLFLTEAYEYEFKKRIEHEFLMNMRKISGMPFSRKLKTLDILHKRYNEEDRNQIITGEASNILKQFEMWGLVNIYDDYNADGHNFTKWGRTIQQYTSLKGLGLNPFSGVNNITFGSIQNKINSVADGDYNNKNHTKAMKFYYNPTAISSYFKKKPETLQAAIIEEYDIMDNQTEEVELNKTSGSKTKFETGAKNTLKAMFFFQHAGEHMLQNTLLFTMLEGHKLINDKIMSFKDFAATKVEVFKPSDTLDQIKTKAKNNKVNLKELKAEFETYKSLMDIHQFVDGKLVFTEEISARDKVEFKDRCKNKAQRLHGIYTKEDLAVMQKYVLGRWAMQFKRWMRPAWNKRFGSRFLQDSGYMESYRERDKGSYKALIDFLGTPMRIRDEKLGERDADGNLSKSGVFSYIKQMEFGMAFTSFTQLMSDYKNFVTNMSIYWNTMTFEDRMKCKQVLIEMLNFIGIIILLAASRYLGDDDDELDNSYAFNFYLLQLDRLKSELGAFQPISIAGAGGMYNELKKLWTNPTATITTFVDTGRLLGEVGCLFNGIGADDYFKTGVYSKELKAKVHFIKAIPLANQIQRWYYLPDNNRFYRLSQ